MNLFKCCYVFLSDKQRQIGVILLIFVVLNISTYMTHINVHFVLRIAFTKARLK